MAPRATPTAPSMSAPPSRPDVPPALSIKEVRDAIPKHCFERSLVRSFSYVLWDLLLIGALFFLALQIDSFCVGSRWPLAFVLWPVYWFVQGAVMTGVWVLAHECGHEAFSDYRSVNHTVGLVLHTMLLVPYHSWRLSHGKHHKSTSHMDRDQVFVPVTDREMRTSEGLQQQVSESPIANLLQIIVMVLFGWPGYLFFNAWSQKNERRTNHFEPSSPIFKPQDRPLIILSDIALLVMVGVLAAACYVFSPLAVAKYYGGPYLWVNFWLVLITYLQHTDPAIPHYRGDQWNFVRGALATVDRNYGVLNFVFHHIGDTHVAHHLFSTMPHYHAQEATEHLRKRLGAHCRRDDTPILKALWRSWTTCHFVADEGDVVFYQKAESESKGEIKSRAPSAKSGKRRYA